MYLLVVILACLITAYLVGLFEGGLVCRKRAGCTDNNNNTTPNHSSATMAAVSNYSETVNYGAGAVATRNSLMSKRSGSSKKFGNGIQTLRQSLLGGNLLPDASDTDSDSLGDTAA